MLRLAKTESKVELNTEEFSSIVPLARTTSAVLLRIRELLRMVDWLMVADTAVDLMMVVFDTSDLLICPAVMLAFRTVEFSIEEALASTSEMVALEMEVLSMEDPIASA